MNKHTNKFVENWMTVHKKTINDMRGYAHNYTGKAYNSKAELFDFLVTLSAKELSFMCSIQY